MVQSHVQLPAEKSTSGLVAVSKSGKKSKRQLRLFRLCRLFRSWVCLTPTVRSSSVLPLFGAWQLHFPFFGAWQLHFPFFGAWQLHFPFLGGWATASKVNLQHEQPNEGRPWFAARPPASARTRVPYRPPSSNSNHLHVSQHLPWPCPCPDPRLWLCLALSQPWFCPA